MNRRFDFGAGRSAHEIKSGQQTKKKAKTDSGKLKPANIHPRQGK